MQTAGFTSSERNVPGYEASRDGLSGDASTRLMPAVWRKVCAAPQLVLWAWDASQGGPGQDRLGSGAGLASALGGRRCWARGIRGPART